MSTRSLSSIRTRLMIAAQVKNTLTSTPSRIATGDLALSFNPSWADGTDSLEANRAWDYSATLAQNASQVVDLYDFGSLNGGSGPGCDILGQALALSEIVAIVIQNLSDPDDSSDSDSSLPGDLEIEPDATAGWTPVGTHTVANGGSIGPGGLFLKIDSNAGFVVTDGSLHRIKLTAKNGSVDYRILVLGRS